MSKKVNPPSVNKKAFECPHCSAHTSQTWFGIYIKEIGGDRGVPNLIEKGFYSDDVNMKKGDVEFYDQMVDFENRMLSGELFVWKGEGSSEYVKCLHNGFMSLCFVCGGKAIWVHEKIIYPYYKVEFKPNNDLPDDIKHDYIEASSIVDLSPRGAAALLRLCVQKLCKELGGDGEHINADIALLVKNGLDVKIQQALDIVRVTGNNAVHPGEMDLKDNREIAVRLFNLVNLIANQMITQPKEVEEMYKQLPQSKLDAIVKRDK